MDLKPERVFMALPCGELARYSDFDATLDGLILPPEAIRQRLFGIYIANIQNELARVFLKTDYEYFWLMNDDQLYPPDTLLRLLAHHKDVVVPMCLEKSEPHRPLIYNEEPGRLGLYRPRLLRRGERGLVRIDASGGGGQLIHRRVLEVIPDPWWEVTTRQAESGKMEQSSEDFDFALKVKNAGFTMWCDLDVSVIHIAHYGLRAMRDEQGNWTTHLIRNQEHVVIPAAVPAKSAIEIPEMKLTV